MLKNYLKIALKVLLRRKLFTAISLFGIVFTLTALISTATIVDHVFGAHPPEVKSNRTLGLFTACMTGKDNTYNSECGYALIEHCTKNLHNVEEMTIFSGFNRETSFAHERTTELWTKYTDADFWHVLQFEFLEGRPYSAEDVRNGRFLTVINAATRKTFFGNEAAVGKAITIDGREFTVVGVVHDVPMLRRISSADVWLPQTTAKSDAYKKDLVGNHMALLVAHDPSQLPGIRTEVDSRLKSVDLSGHPGFDRITTHAETYFENVARNLIESQGPQAPTTGVIGGAIAVALLFMLLPAVNLTNLAASRILERATEIGVRKAFGASSRILIGQFIIENLVLTLIGSLLAVGASALFLSWLTSTGWIPYAEFHFNLRIVTAALAFTAVFALLSGIYPAWRMSRLHPDEVLRGRLK